MSVSARLKLFFNWIRKQLPPRTILKFLYTRYSRMFFVLQQNLRGINNKFTVMTFSGLLCVGGEQKICGLPLIFFVSRRTKKAWNVTGKSQFGPLSLTRTVSSLPLQKDQPPHMAAKYKTTLLLKL